MLLNSDNDDLTELTRLLKDSRCLFVDKRLYEVAGMLSSHFPKPLHSEKSNLSDMKYLKYQQFRLLQLSLRSLALPVARGMLTLKIAKGYYHFPLRVPKLNLLGEVHENKANINLNLNELDIPAKLKRSFSGWPSFNNGAASGMMQVQSSTVFISEQLYFCEVTDPFTEGGVLLGRSLIGALDNISLVNCYRRVKRTQPPIRMALLLGLACTQASKAKLTSRDQQIFKFICLHIPNAFPVAIRKLKSLTPEINSIAILSLGIFKAQQNNTRMLTSFFISSLKHIHAGSKDEVSQLKCLQLFTGFALGFLGLFCSDVEKKAILAEVRPLVDRKKKNYQRSKFSTLKEGKNINTTLYEPGVFVALSLLFSDTNNKEVLSLLRVPNQKPAIVKCTPEHMLLRLLCETIVCKENASDITSIKARIPNLLFDSDAVKQENYLIAQRFYAFAGVLLGLALKNNNSNPKLVETFKEIFEEFFVLSLVCKWIKLKKPLKNWVKPKIKHLITFEELVLGMPSSCVVSDCLVIVSNALALLASSSCDLSILRLLRKARSNLETFNYGHHMGINMSIGLLFLSAGEISIKRDKLDQAFLLLAFYPLWPKTPSDNEYHHQIARNLYVLATKRRTDRKAHKIEKSKYNLKNPLL